MQQSDVSGDADADWNERHLGDWPHPGSSEAQQKVIALDDGMRSGTAEIRVRKALLYYAFKKLGLDTDPAARAPNDQQIVLLETREALG